MDAKRRIFDEKPDEGRLAIRLRSRDVFLDFNVSHKMARMMLDGEVEVPEDLRWGGYVVPASANCKPVSMGTGEASRDPGCDDDRDCARKEAKKTAGEVFHPERSDPEFPFGQGPRAKGQARPTHGPGKRGEDRRHEYQSPTNSERFNRALDELSPGAAMVVMLFWKWRGRAAKGVLPFFTIHYLAWCLGTSRPRIRRRLGELVSKGWIEPGQYDKHHKNTLVKLVPIRKVPVPGTVD